LLLAGCVAPSSLQVIDNVLFHKAPPALVRDLLARPSRATAIFLEAVARFAARRIAHPERGVPIALRR